VTTPLPGDKADDAAAAAAAEGALIRMEDELP
jgi:hypothetical protein